MDGTEGAIPGPAPVPAQETSAAGGGLAARLSARLATASPLAFAAYAVAASFATYFCVYGYRKAFAAGTYAGSSIPLFGGHELALKSAFVISQVIGYTASKFLGIKLLSELPHERRAFVLIATIVLAQLTLVVFAVASPWLQVVAMLLNGLPLGIAWGLVYGFLEGRRTSEILGAGLSCSFIVASGAAKSAGVWVMGGTLGVSESWMPATVGLLYLPVFLASVWLLARLPAPSPDDVAARVRRAPMSAAERWAFLRVFLGGLVLLIVIYFFLTAYRDYRDNFAVEIFREVEARTVSSLVLEAEALPPGSEARAREIEAEIADARSYYRDTAIFTKTEIPISLAVLGALALLYLVKDNLRGFFLTHAIMGAGAALIGASTIAFDRGWIDGVWWMILVGLGLFLAYVPYGCVLFDRLVAAMGTVATAVFTIYVADALGYTGVIAVLLYKNFAHGEVAHLDFFRGFSYFTSALGIACFAGSAWYFQRKRRAVR